MLIRDILDIKARDAGPARLHGVSPDSRMAAAVHTMAVHGIGSVLVRQGERLVGLMTLREILAALDTHGAAALDMAVDAVMNTRPITGSPDDSIDQVRRVMTEHHISHLPVMAGGELLDIISLQDVAKAAYSECSFENRLLKHYISHWPEGPERAGA